jgi:hypothetical protein
VPEFECFGWPDRRYVKALTRDRKRILKPVGILPVRAALFLQRGVGLIGKAAANNTKTSGMR